MELLEMDINTIFLVWLKSNISVAELIGTAQYRGTIEEISRPLSRVIDTAYAINIAPQIDNE